MSCLCTPPCNCNHTPHPSFLAHCFQLTSYKRLSRRGAEPRCIRGSAHPKPRGPTAGEERLKKGWRWGEHIFLPPPPCRYACLFFPAASPTLFKAGSFLSRTGCAGSCRLEDCSPVAPARILPSREGTPRWGGSSHRRQNPSVRPAPPAPAQVHLPGQKARCLVSVVLDVGPKGMCLDLKLIPVPSGRHL